MADQFLTHLETLLKITASFYTIYVACQGLKIWKDQHKWKAKHDFFSEAIEEISHLRNVVNYSDTIKAEDLYKVAGVGSGSYSFSNEARLHKHFEEVSGQLVSFDCLAVKANVYLPTDKTETLRRVSDEIKGYFGALRFILESKKQIREQAVAVRGQNGGLEISRPVSEKEFEARLDNQLSEHGEYCRKLRHELDELLEYFKEQMKV